MTNEELAVAAKAGDESKLLELWDQNSGFIHGRAYAWKQAFPQVGWVDMEDLVSVSWFALLDAVKYFDPDVENANFLIVFSWFQKSHFYKALGLRRGSKQKPPFIESLDAPLSADESDGDTFLSMQEDEAAQEDFYRIEMAHEQAQMRAVLDQVATDSLSHDERLVYETALVYEDALRGNRFLTGRMCVEETGINAARLSTLKEQMLEILRTDTRVMQLWLDYTGQDVKVEEIAERCIKYAGTRSFTNTGYSSVEMAVFRLLDRKNAKSAKADDLGYILWKRALQARAEKSFNEMEERRRRRLEEAQQDE